MKINRYTALFTGACSLAAGALHVGVVSAQHWTPFPPLETGFFLTVGLLQMLLGIRFLVAPGLTWYRLSLLLNGGVATLYVLMQFLPVPFVGEPESLAAIGIIVAALELLAVAASLHWLLTHEEYGARRTIPATTAGALAFMLLGGFGYYGSAQSMTMLLPDRTVAHEHGHADNHQPSDAAHSQDTASSAGSSNDGHHQDTAHHEEKPAGHHTDDG